MCRTVSRSHCEAVTILSAAQTRIFTHVVLLNIHFFGAEEEFLSGDVVDSELYSQINDYAACQFMFTRNSVT
jgi:hypothetical protein